MPKNALFLLKNRKNRRALGALPQTPLPLASWGFAPRSPWQIAGYVLVCSCKILEHTYSFTIIDGLEFCEV